MEKRHQHVTPECYLKAWCDPATPSGQTPYIWIHVRDGSTCVNKAPKKVFRELEFYTIKLSDGSRCLDIEDSFSVIEDRFTQLRDRRIVKGVWLSDADRGLLCVFSAMTFVRTKSERESFLKFYTGLHDMTVSMEEQHKAEPVASSMTAAYKKYGHHVAIGHSIQTIVEALFAMNLAIFVAPDGEAFITSDEPCVWHNPQAHKFPPMLRSPGLAQQDIEITLPISPQFLALFSWNKWNERMTLDPEFLEALGHCAPAPKAIVDELNRRTRGLCREYFVTRDGKTEPIWFELGEEPADSWNKTYGQKTNASRAQS
jgi:hypothetical protein